jgi:hypothetical protein
MIYRPKPQFWLPNNWQDFELLCWSLWKTIWGDPGTQRHGRSGQKQDGVDIFGRPNKRKEWAGVQCKGKENFTNQQLTETELISEVDKAKNFEPSLSAFIVATTAPRDERIQEAARKLTDLHKSAGLFTVSVCSWNDIEELMLEHKPKIARDWYQFLCDEPSNADIMAAIHQIRNVKPFANVEPPHPASKEISSLRKVQEHREHDTDISEHDVAVSLRVPMDVTTDRTPVTVADIQALSAKLDQISGLLAGQVASGSTSSDTSFNDAVRRATSKRRKSSPQGVGIRGSTRSEPVPFVAQQDKLGREASTRVSETLSTELPTFQDIPLHPSREGDVLTDETAVPKVLALEDRIRRELSLWNYDSALSIAEELERVCTGNMITEQTILARVLFLLARVHVICAERKDLKAKDHIDRAKFFLAQIESMSSTSVSEEMKTDIEALRGSIENLEKGPDAALARLAGRTNPYAIRIRLAMLLNKQDLDGAVALIEDLPPNDRWCDLAVTVYVLRDRQDDAEKLVKWAAAQQDRSKYPQCVVRLADALLVRSLTGHEKGKNIQPHDLSEEERDNVRAVLKTLQPVLDPIVATGQVDSELGVTAVKIASQVNHLLRNREDVAKLTRLMFTHRPVPVDVARSVVSGYIEPPPDLPERLREEHPSDLEAKILAVVVQSSCMGQHKEAFIKAKELIPLADTDGKKEVLFNLFQQIWHELEGDAVSDCERIVALLAAHNPKLQAVFEAARALRAKDPDAAIRALDKEKAEGDIYWLQLRANALMQKHQLGDAVDFLLIAAKMTLDPMLLRKTADLAFQTEKTDIAVWCYERLVEIQSDNLVARGNLASIYTFHLHNVEKAAAQFRALHEAEPKNPDHTVNLAICLAHLYRPKESLALYAEACGLDMPDIRAVIGRAELHLSLADPDAAFASLQDFRQRFWNDPNFLLAFMNTAYAVGNEEAAHEALEALNKLREAGLVEPNAFRMIPTDEGIEMLKKRVKHAQERTEHLHSEMLKGRMPWVWAEQVSGNAIYWGWRMRTQEMAWMVDDPVNRANLCIYTTNSFHPRKSERGRSELLPLEPPLEGTRVVADISSLITLHRLELLDMAADYFGEIMVPEGYLSTVLEDSRKMVFPQRSRQQSAERIAQKAESGIITVLGKQTILNTSMAIADEHGEPGKHCYRLIDLLRPVHDAGVISDAAFEQISKVCKKKSSADETHPELTQLQDVLIDLSTLETLTVFALLESITGYYKVHITDEAYTEIRHRLEAIHYQEETRRWHFDLWNRLRNDSRFHFVSYNVPQEMRKKDGDPKDYMAFLGNLIAQETAVPLLADDRVCQALALNERPEAAHAAFGTNALISALMKARKLDVSKAGESIRLLMKWRYRFILPKADILKALAEQYRNSPPGQALQEIAEYVHDCMRDAGLFGGSEKTELGESMAMRLYLSWLLVISKFLISIWEDESFSEKSARRLTEWSVQELLPSPPGVLHGNLKVRISSMTARYLLSHTLINSNTLPKGERMGDAMKALKDALKLSDDEYMRIVTETLDDTRRTESQP